MYLANRRSIAGHIAASAGLAWLTAFIGAQPLAAQGPAPQAPAAQSAPTPEQPVPPAPPAQGAQWKTYSFPADGFSASFPFEPVQQKQSVQTGAGAFELRTYVAANPSVALYIGVCDYGAAAQGSDPDAVLEGAKNGAVSNVSGHLISSKRIMLGTYPGVAFEADSQGSHFFGRIYLAGTMLYQVFVAVQPGQTYPETARFLDSFQLIPRPSQ
jgi:hypothetical protein